MAVRINGAARGGEFISSNLQFYILYTTLDITQTDSYQKKKKKDFDALVQMIAMFSQVIISNDPVNVADLNANGAPTLTGAGYVFKFAVEHADVFNDGSDPIGNLKSSMDGVVLNGGTIATTGSINLEFTQSETL